MAKKSLYSESFNPERIKRETTQRILRLGLISLGVVVLTLWLGLKTFPLTTSLPQTIGNGENVKPINWSILDGIASLITMSLVVGGIVFAFLENVQSAVQRSRENAVTSFNIYKEVYDRLMNPEALAARRWIITNIATMEDSGKDKKAWLLFVENQLDNSPSDWKGARPPGREYLKSVLNTFDFVGFIAKHYWSMENELVLWMSPLIAKVWERIEVFVENEAEIRNEPDYYESARQFGKYCVEWRRGKYPKSIIIDNAT